MPTINSLKKELRKEKGSQNPVDISPWPSNLKCKCSLIKLSMCKAGLAELGRRARLSSELTFPWSSGFELPFAILEGEVPGPAHRV